MKLDDIIMAVDAAYPDGLIQQAFDDPKHADRIGDSLAVFIMRELRDCYDADANDRQQIKESQRRLRTAKRELLACIRALSGVRKKQRAAARERKQRVTES